MAIANANAMGEDGDRRLTEGVTLNVPTMARTGNSFSDYKPQNIGELIGDTTPNLPMGPRPVETQCNAIATLIVIVVQVVVLKFTQNPVLANYASQVVGMAIGQREEFSAKELAVATATYYASVGAAEYLQGAGPVAGVNMSTTTTTAAGVTTTTLTPAGAAIQAGATVAATAVANKLVGNPSGFSWQSMAASMATAAIGSKIGLSDPSNPIYSASETGGILFDTFSGIARAGINQGIKRALGDTESHFNFRDTALDAFGNALGNAAVREINERAAIKAENEFNQSLKNFDEYMGNMFANVDESALYDPEINARKIAINAGINPGEGASIAGISAPDGSDEGLANFIQNVRDNRNQLELSGGKILDPSMLDKARKRNAYDQYWPGSSVAIINDDDLINSLRNNESGLFSQESLYLYQSQADGGVSEAMASFVLSMGEYDDVGVMAGLRQLMSGAEYVDITGIVSNSVAAVEADYVGYTGFNFRKASEMEGTILLERLALSMMDGTSRTVSSAFNDKLPTFMQNEAFNDVALSVASAAYGGVAKLAGKIKLGKNSSSLGLQGARAGTDATSHEKLKAQYRSLDPDYIGVDELNINAKSPTNIDNVYVPRDSKGNIIRLETDNANVVVYPLKEAEGRAHTAIGGKVSERSGEVYRQSATFMEGNEIPWGRVDWSDHGMPFDHPEVHIHPLQSILNKSGQIVDWQQGPIIPFRGH